MSYVVEYPYQGERIVMTFRPTLVERMFGVYDRTKNVSWTSSTTGWAWVSNERPPTNPWRHACVRAKHFRRASGTIQASAYRFYDWCGCPPYEPLPPDRRFLDDADWREELAAYAHEMARFLAYVSIADAAVCATAAAENADWGCR